MRKLLGSSAGFLAVVIAIISSPYAIANIFDNQDYRMVRTLKERISAVLVDTLHSETQVVSKGDTYADQCLEHISQEIKRYDDYLNILIVLTSINIKMVNESDEKVISKYALNDISQILKTMPISRKIVNLSAQECPDSGIVTIKARAALNLFTEIENALRLLVGRG